MKRSNIIFLVFSFVCLLVVSCSKDSGEVKSSSATSILDSQVLTYLPNSSIGFVTWDTQSDSYKRMKASAWGKSMSRSYELLKKYEDQADDETKKLVRIADGLVQTGFWPKSANDVEVLKSGVAYFNIDTTKKLPEIGIFGVANEGNDLQAKIAAVQAIIDKESIKTNKESLSGGTGFSIDFEEAKASGSPVNKVFVIATKDKVAVGTSPEVVARFLSNPAEGGIQKIKDSNEFKLATGGMAAGDSMTFAFLDFNKLVSSLEAVAAATGADTGSTELKEVPVQSLAMASIMKDSLSNTVTVSLNPRNDMQKKVIGSFAGGGGKNDLVKRVPSDIMLLLSIDGGTIASIKKSALEEMPPEALGPLQSTINLLDSIKTLAIGIRAAAGASPFPEVMLVAESTQAAEIEKTIKVQLEVAMAASGMPLPWQQKDIADSKVTYALSPFGVGAYLTSSGESVILTTGEKLVGDILQSGKNESQGLLASLSQNSKDIVNNSKSIVVAYSDFTKIGNTLGTVQDSLAMFTGGKANIPREQIENIKQMGSVMLSLNLDNNLVKLQSNYELPPVAKN